MSQGTVYGVPIDTDPTMALNSNQVVPSQAAVVSYVGTQVATKVASVSGTLNRISSSGGLTPVIDIDAAYVGQASITTLGTVTTGTWNATDIALADGGTNASLIASNGGIFYSTATAGAILSGTATEGQIIRSGASSAPSWSTATYPATTTINRILYSSANNTVSEITAANSAVLVSTSTGVPQMSSTMTNGQVIIGSTGGTPTAATITAGAGISITNAAGSITVAAAGGGLTWSVITADQGATVNNAYICNKAGLLTLTLPASADIGDTIRVTGINTALGWKIAQNANQRIHFGTSSTTTGVGGSLASVEVRDSIELVCVVAGSSTEYNVISSVGNITVV